MNSITWFRRMGGSGDDHSSTHSAFAFNPLRESRNMSHWLAPKSRAAMPSRSDRRAWCIRRVRQQSRGALRGHQSEVSSSRPREPFGKVNSSAARTRSSWLCDRVHGFDSSRVVALC
jgi:hypothetical protein